MAKPFRTPVQFKWSEGWPNCSDAPSALDMLEQLPEQYRRGIDYDAAVSAAKRVIGSDAADDVEAARKAITFFTDKLPR